MAIVYDRLIAVAQRQGAAAGEMDRLAAALWPSERIAPNSAAHAFALRRVGRQARDRGELARAATAYSQALDAVEAHSQLLGGSNEVRTAYAGQRRAIYLEYTDILMGLGQQARAFDVLERSRARGLLMMLAERDLVLDGDLSAELKQTTRDLREEDDRVQASLAKLDPQRNAADIDRLRARQRELREKRNQVIESVRAASPRLAALQYPQALTLAQVQQTLDAGTVVLSYQVGADASRLFVVRRSSAAGKESLTVHTIAIGEAGLREQVTAFRRLIERDITAERRRPVFINCAGSTTCRLHRRHPLSRPPTSADTRGRTSASLPFAALVRPARGSGGRSWQYLVEWKPLHTALSATVYAELRKGPRLSSGASTLVAFGDPQYPVSGSVSVIAPDVQAMLRSGYTLTPLPATRAEVNALSRGFGKQATVYLGSDATEARAKSIAKTRYLHFATHGILDARSPLDSALVLTVPAERRPGEENGLLQAWEIFEQLRIDADLVTLSACETALGDDVAGEGLIG